MKSQAHCLGRGPALLSCKAHGRQVRPGLVLSLPRCLALWPAHSRWSMTVYHVNECKRSQNRSELSVPRSISAARMGRFLTQLLPTLALLSAQSGRPSGSCASSVHPLPPPRSVFWTTWEDRRGRLGCECQLTRLRIVGEPGGSRLRQDEPVAALEIPRVTRSAVVDGGLASLALSPFPVGLGSRLCPKMRRVPSPQFLKIKSKPAFTWILCTQCSFYWVLQILCFFHKLKVCGHIRQTSLLVPFFQQHVPAVCLCCILAVLTMPQTFHSVCYGELWSVIFDVATVIVCGAPWGAPV